MAAQELGLDYFKFYDAENCDAQVDLLLRGQFERRFQMIQLRPLEFFGNAVSKNG